MTAKTAASAVFALVSMITFAGCTPSQRTHTPMTAGSPAAFDALAGAHTRLVAGDILGVDLHLAAASRALLADAR